MGDRSSKGRGHLRIRSATPDDAHTIHAAILGIAEAVGQVAKVTSTPQDIARHGFGEEPAFGVLIAEMDDVFAGLCLYFPSFSTWYGRPGVYVQDLYVEPAFRGRGVGERLLRRLAAQTRDGGGVYLRLSVDVENSSAQRFYEKIGLEWSREEKIFAARGEAFLALAKDDGEHG
jgi:ribosomal protein S18 acetylase RimI-like enzyme